MSLLNSEQRRRASSFTLVELLVAMAIMLLILAVCLVLTLTAQSFLNNGMERIDADSQARLFFDRMTLDLAAMVKRSDVDYILKDSTQSPTAQNGNDSLAFFARTTGYFSTSPDLAARKVSLLAYRVNSQTYQLERLALGIGWNSSSSGTNMVYQPVAPAIPGLQIYNTWASAGGLNQGVAGLNQNYPDLDLGTDPTDYQVLADSVFRFEYCYILRDGSLSTVPYLTPHTALNGWQDVTALYVAIAVLDDKSRLVVAHGGTNPNLAAVTSSLKDFTLGVVNGVQQPYPPLVQWQSVINQANFATQANLPVKIAPAVRVYARSIPINNWPPDLSL